MFVRSPFPDVTIPDITLTSYVLRHAQQCAQKPALIDGATGQTLTYGQLADRINRAAAGLERRGLRKGEVLAIFAPNSLDYVVAFHAAAALGGVVMPVNPLATASELRFRLVDAGATYLLTSPDALDTAREAMAMSAVRELIVFGEASGATPFSALLAETGPPLPAPEIDPRRDLAALLYSSGTSGLPKGVMITHRNLVAAQCQMAVSDVVHADEVVFGVLPFFHAYGLGVLHLVLSSGATLIFTPRFVLGPTLRTLQDYRVTRAFVAPPTILTLSKDRIVADFDLSRLRVLHAGGAPLSATVAHACAARLGCEVRQGYALTECYPALRMGAADPDMLRAESVGRCVPNTECRIIDPETGTSLGPGEAGELLLRGPQVMQGYLNQPEATAQACDADGWLRTGDIGFVDDEGFFTIVDRLKELIKYKGFQVAPAELEALLLSHPAVADAAVIPSPDENAGEVPKAFVVLKAEATAEELMAFVAERVAPYKKVRRIEFVDQIPKSASGKILRRVLVERERATAQVPVLV